MNNDPFFKADKPASIILLDMTKERGFNNTRKYDAEFLRSKKTSQAIESSFLRALHYEGVTFAEVQ